MTEKVNIQGKEVKSKDKVTNDKVYRVDFAVSINRATKNPKFGINTKINRNEF